MNFTKIAPFLKAARNQVAAADGLVINKVDLASEQELQTLETLLTKMNPRAAQVRATRGEVTYAFLDSLSHRRTTEALALAQPEAIHASSYRSTKPVDRGEFEQAVDSLGKQLLRLKGHILFSDSEHYEFVETVCGKMSVKPAEAEVRATSFTAIAFGLPDGQLDRVFTPFDDTE